MTARYPLRVRLHHAAPMDGCVPGPGTGGYAVAWEADRNGSERSGSIKNAEGKIVCRCFLAFQPDGTRLLTLYPLKGYRKDVKRFVRSPLLKEISCGSVARYCLEQLQAMRDCGPKIGGDDAGEALHDYRIAVRKTRSVLSVIPPKASGRKISGWKKFFGSLGTATSSVRDLDVLLGDMRTIADGYPEGSFTSFLEHLEKKRIGSFASLCNLLHDRSYRKMLDDWEAMVRRHGDNWSPISMDSAIRRQFGRFLAAAAAVSGGTEESRFHQVRKEAKKTRYLIGISSRSPESGGSKELSASLALVQDILGRKNDLAVRRRVIREYLDGTDADGRERSLLIGIVVSDTAASEALADSYRQQFARIAAFRFPDSEERANQAVQQGHGEG